MTDQEDNSGKIEIAVRVLGNELMAIRMVVDDFKMKWLIVGIAAMAASGWVITSFGPALVGIFN
jgi:hypothetical protein